jgi:hypothetical protein
MAFMLGQQKGENLLQQLGTQGVLAGGTGASGEQFKTLGGAGLTAGQEVLKRQTQEALEKTQSFERMFDLFRGSVAQFQGRVIEQAGQSGIFPGIFGNIRAGLSFPKTGRIKAEFGQQMETALAQSRVLTGQNRVIKSLINNLRKSLPQGTDTTEQVASKIIQSLTNSYKVFSAARRHGFTLADLNRMTDADIEAIGFDKFNPSNIGLSSPEQEELDILTQRILNEPPSPYMDLATWMEDKSGPTMEAPAIYRKETGPGIGGQQNFVQREALKNRIKERLLRRRT